MNTTSFLSIIDDKTAVSNVDLGELDSVLESFPYFQSARMLYLKKLKLNNNFLFNSVLKTTAAYVNDRTVLFEYITNDFIVSSIEEKRAVNIVPDEPQEINKEIVVKETIDQDSELKLEEKEPSKDIEEDKVHKTLNFSNNDRFSFNEWLQLSSIKEIHRDVDNKIVIKKVEELKNRKSNFELINKFIDSNPKLKPLDKKERATSNISLSSSKENSGWMTETLAQVFIEQKKYSKAIKAYEVLGLKYPEKSGFFADRIREIKTISE